ncbi:hypothetical protein CAEBREN_16276 [Caenorhabditis brenneri]|uniref:Uncharacterized protein n=1 Tax=Caenorhabditis brenneri TaxID=135651 RepID=G0MMG3_CAEBE|nr:hypothetical protein CAEBREN_16276 [Caenorhabditis brenneri]
MDPNNSRPISYDSLKILLQYAKPNLRFELFRRIPSIRLTEKAVPLRLNSLRIGGHGVEINNTYYEARIIRYFPPSGIVPRGFRFDNLSNDGEWDLDEWGFDDFSSETVFTPGDLVLQVQEHNHRRRIQSEAKKDLEKRLKYVEWMIAKKSGENVESEWTGQIIQLLRDWIENPREIGKCLSFEEREKRVMETMTQIQATFEGVKAERSMKIPVNDVSQIAVSYESQVRTMRRRRIRIMTIEVMAV